MGPYWEPLDRGFVVFREREFTASFAEDTGSQVVVYLGFFFFITLMPRVE